MTARNGVWSVLVMVLVSGCAPSGETASPSRQPSVSDLYQEGHRLYLHQKRDSATAVLTLVLQQDSTHIGALADLAALSYERAREVPGDERADRFREAYSYLRRQEAIGSAQAETYERLCELSAALNDTRGFVTYAKRYADLYPHDRQTYNLGLALFEAGRYQDVIALTKQSVAKFVDSPYLGGFYLQMGRAYMKVDRDQTATRTLESGVKAVDARIHAMGSDVPAQTAVRMAGDRRAILRALRQLYTTYKETGKLRWVDRQLNTGRP